MNYFLTRTEDVTIFDLFVTVTFYSAPAALYVENSSDI